MPPMTCQPLVRQDYHAEKPLCGLSPVSLYHACGAAKHVVPNYGTSSWPLVPFVSSDTAFLGSFFNASIYEMEALHTVGQTVHPRSQTSQTLHVQATQHKWDTKCCPR